MELNCDVCKFWEGDGISDMGICERPEYRQVRNTLFSQYCKDFQSKFIEKEVKEND